MSFTEIPYVNDYLALSIVSVVCSGCCFFVGLVAFYKTIEVKNCILYFSYPLTLENRIFKVIVVVFL